MQNEQGSMKWLFLEIERFSTIKRVITVSESIDQKQCGKRLAYVRVSKKTQKEDRQLIALEDQCDEMFVEKISAVAKHRPVFDKVMGKLKAGDTFVILDLDRAFRSTVEAIQTAEVLRDRGVNFKIVNANIDTSSEFGEIIYGILALIAQFERKIMIRRTMEGLDAARKRGQKLGRPYALTNKQIRKAHRLVSENNQPVYEVAKHFGIAHSTLALSFDRLGLVAK